MLCCAVRSAAIPSAVCARGRVVIPLRALRAWRSAAVPMRVREPPVRGRLSCGAWLQMLHVAGRGVVPKPDGVVLSCAAAGIVRNLTMRIQEPISGAPHFRRAVLRAAARWRAP